MTSAQVRGLTQLAPSDLASFVAENAPSLTEDEALAILDNRHVTPQIIGRLAGNPRITAFYSVRARLVAHRQTPQAHATKLIHYLYWFDLLRLSVDVQVPAPVRRAIDNSMLARVEKLSIGERVASARRCSHALVKVFLYDESPLVFEALLINKKLREDDLLALMSSDRATTEQLGMIAADTRWAFRYTIRKALVLNPRTPRAAAATQLRYLSRTDLRHIHSNPRTTTYVKRCIERMRPDEFMPVYFD